MNPSCCACQNQAIRVCIHPDCQFVPFLCENRCKNNVALKMHTHSDKPLLIPYSKLDEYLSKLGDQDNQDFMNTIRKRVYQIQASLEGFLEQVQSELSVKILRLSKNSRSMIDIILSKNHEDLRGRDMHLLLEGKDIYQNQQKAGQDINNIKDKFDRALDSIQQTLERISLGQEFDLGICEVDQKSKEPEQPEEPEDLPETQSLQHTTKGNEFFEKKEYLDALGQFLISSKYNPFEPYNAFKIGCCLSQLKCEDQINQYKKSIELGATDNILLSCYLHLSSAYYGQERLEEGFQMMNQAVKVDKTPKSLTARAGIHILKEQYMPALVDLSEAIQIDPTNSDLYIKRGECYSKLEMTAEALADCLKAVQVSQS